MMYNPFKYKGPLEPTGDRQICVSREAEVKDVLSGIMKGEYWAILGPQQVGKTTFLHLLRERFPQGYYIHLHLETQPLSELAFYKDLVKRLLSEVPMKNHVEIQPDDWETLGAPFVFLNLIRNIQPENPLRKIIFLLDEVDGLPYLTDFLKMWRQVFHERFKEPGLKRYSVIVTGTIDLVSLTCDGPTSPFNIAETLFLKDFSYAESQQMFQDTFGKLGIRIEENALAVLLKWLGGHPQLLQHAGSFLISRANDLKYPLTESHVSEAIKCLVSHNTSIYTLRQNVLKNDLLRGLLIDLLEGKKRNFFRFRELAFYGSGAIVEKGSFCAIRNELFKEVIANLLANQTTYKGTPLLSNGTEGEVMEPKGKG